MKKNPSVAVLALMLALLVLAAAPGGARSACDASQLAVCLSAIPGGAAPTAGCCANLKAPMDGTYHTGGLDLNEPFTEDVIMLDDMPDKQAYGSKTGQCNKEDESNKTGNEKNATWSNASEKEAVTGETISTDESGIDDEVKSTPCSQTDVQKLYP
ncbi:hypothetical protein QYE76_071892 [Lolium multiflorum]|uniref:Bifunctional inhibitor/plant lipid transfer protein/seed storage helical domain-containing protein n=1 Tax=Lolium multiflorum TaxID=4521 RepID=A0AAD8SMY7_LOLMU|nr:hypothetical protein QYE76_071892 [Lolium multiflorum]